MTLPPVVSTRPARLVFVFLILAAAYAHHRWVYIPWRGEWENVETSLARIASDIAESSQTLMTQEAILSDHVTSLVGRLHTWESKLPDSPILLRLPAWIQTQAREWGLRLVSLRLEPVQAEGAYSGERIHITVEGRYHDVGRFLAALSSATYLLHVSELRMTSIQDHRVVRVSLWIDTYVRPWVAPSTDVQIGLLIGHSEAPFYPTEPLADPLDLHRGKIQPAPGSGWPRLRMLLLAPDAERSIAAFDGDDASWRGPGGGGPREPYLRVRIGDRLGSATVVGLGARGVKVRRDGEATSESDIQLIPLEPGARPRTRRLDPDSGTP